MTATEIPNAVQGAVVLDIGGEVGALVVTTPAGLIGAEIEICPAGHRNHRPDEGGHWWQGEWRSTRQDHPHRSNQQRPRRLAWPHVAVLPRRTSAGIRHAAVFPALRRGTYELWLRPHGPTALTATVTGGTVTTATWPSRS